MRSRSKPRVLMDHIKSLAKKSQNDFSIRLLRWSIHRVYESNA